MTTEKAVEVLRNAIRVRHLSWKTEQCYRGWLLRYCAHLKKARDICTSEKNVESFLSKLARDGVAATTQNQAFNAICFFYKHGLRRPLDGVDAMRAKTGQRVRVAPSIDEMRRLLPAIKNRHGYPTNLICRLLYGCGLRVSEGASLRIRDLRFSESQLIVRGAKGNKDRVINLPCELMTEIGNQVEASRAMWKQDAAQGLPVTLPGRLDKKYPNSRFAWNWFWLFPAHRPCDHPRSGERVRYHLHAANIQRAVKAASGPLGMDVTPHYFRHAYASHSVNAGVSVRDVQNAMGHANLNTTMVYLTPDAMRVPSPLALLERATA
jgi:integron integrase